jgi:preprotein translocase subunit SecB
MAQDNNSPVFSLDKLYIKDMSLEVPNAPKIFLNREQPNIELNLSFNTEMVDEGVYHTVLHAVVSAKVGEEQLFLIELDQAGIFQMRNIPADQLELLHNIDCPNFIFPYLRESVSDLTTRAGFMPVLLSPVNFAYLYQQKKQAETSSISASIN